MCIINKNIEPQKNPSDLDIISEDHQEDVSEDQEGDDFYLNFNFFNDVEEGPEELMFKVQILQEWIDKKNPDFHFLYDGHWIKINYQWVFYFYHPVMKERAEEIYRWLQEELNNHPIE